MVSTRPRCSFGTSAFSQLSTMMASPAAFNPITNRSSASEAAPCAKYRPEDRDRLRAREGAVGAFEADGRDDFVRVQAADQKPQRFRRRDQADHARRQAHRRKPQRQQRAHHPGADHDQRRADQRRRHAPGDGGHGAAPATSSRNAFCPRGVKRITRECTSRFAHPQSQTRESSAEPSAPARCWRRSLQSMQGRHRVRR